MMNERNRTKLRLILAEYKLLFLRPKYREEQYLFDERGTCQNNIYSQRNLKSTENYFQDLEVLEIYRAIKARGDTGHSAGAVINLIWENQLDGKKLKPVSYKVI